MCEVPNSLNRVEDDETYADYGITPAQYHAGLDKLWKALGHVKRSGEHDVFALCSERIKNLQYALQDARIFSAWAVNVKVTVASS